MGRNSGGNSGGSNAYANTGQQAVMVNGNGKKLTKTQVQKVQNSLEGLDALGEREVVKQMRRAISRYEKVMGVRSRNVRVADIDGSYGLTYFNGHGPEMVILNKKFFSQKKNVIESQYRKENYDTGFKNKTNRPIQHTLTHELAHATWTSGYSSPKHQAAGKEIKSLYKKWMNDSKKKGYGTYGRKNVDEFWAEVIAKGVHGNSDKYTKKAIGIAKKYKL